jgi:nicotinamide phosphoribosyltransferase
MKIFAPHMVDGYKLGHAPMYTSGTCFLYSNLTPRSNKYFAGSALYDGKMVVFGQSGALQEIYEDWNESFFSQPKEKVIKRYKRRVDMYLGKGVISTERMEELHDLGFLPLEIKTLDEGSRIGMKIPMLTIKNTLPSFFWLVNYMETALSAMIWKSTTNATIAFEYLRILTHWAVKTGVDVESVIYQAHDFSMRGMPGYETASRCSSGHLAVGLVGTDTVGAIDYIEDYYGEGLDLDNYLIGCSIPATEHAVSSSNILTRLARMEKELTEEEKEGRDLRFEAEVEFLKHYITEVVPSGFCSYVLDTYAYYKMLSEGLVAAKDEIMARDGRVVIRPDSGYPEVIICGYKVFPIEFAHEDCLSDYEIQNGFYNLCDYQVVKVNGVYRKINKDGDVTIDVVPEVEVKGSIQVLWEIFGGTVNEAGYKVLDPHVGLIYGDSITLERAWSILAHLEANGFASSNVVFGVGSYTYQMNTRDTFGTAMKATATAVETDGVEEFFEIYKDPATGDKLKQSAKGFLYVGRDENGEFFLEDQVSAEQEAEGELHTRVKDGFFYNLDNIKIVRERLKAS